jgi:hypothetical protein
MSATDYLKKRGHTYYVRIQIPPPLWPAAGGKREFIKTLKTGDLTEANRRKHAYIAAFNRKIEGLPTRRYTDAEVRKALAERGVDGVLLITVRRQRRGLGGMGRLSARLPLRNKRTGWPSTVSMDG